MMAISFSMTVSMMRLLENYTLVFGAAEFVKITLQEDPVVPLTDSKHDPVQQMQICPTFQVFASFENREKLINVVLDQ